MARLEKPILGKLGGRAGNFVGRFIGDEHFISVRPRKYKVKKKIDEVKPKQRFQFAVKIAGNVVHIPELKEVWNNCTMQGKRGYNRVITANYKLLNDNHPTTKNIITPNGCKLLFDKIEQTNSNIKFSYGTAGLIPPPFKLFLMFVFSIPRGIEDSPILIYNTNISITPEDAKINSDERKELNFIADYTFDGNVLGCKKRFRDVILYLTVVGTPAIKNQKWWTSTVAVDMSSII